MLGISKYVELKGKADKGEAIRSITFGEMCEQFIAQEKRNISSIPHQGITQNRFRLLSQLTIISSILMISIVPIDTYLTTTNEREETTTYYFKEINSEHS
tara:strand:+ start:63 stop:362 length:300 start_codon:yes stop_codon:yes gene_type:complete